MADKDKTIKLGKCIKVLVYIPFYGVDSGADGVSSYIVNLYQNLDRNHIHFDIISFYEGKAFYDETILELGAKVIKHPLENLKGITKKKAIAKYIVEELKNGQYDVFYLQASVQYDHLYMHYVHKNTDVPIRIIHSHNSSFTKQKGLIIRKMLGSFSKRFEMDSNHYFACSSYAAKFMFTSRLIKSGKVQIINNGVNVEKFKYDEELSFRMKKGLGLIDKIVIGHVGRFTYQKNHEFLIDILKACISINSHVILLLIGEGELEESIKMKVKLLGLEKNVLFYGNANNVNELLQVMDVFVMPSFYEGLPVVGIEAQASGLPIIVSDRITNELGITDNIMYLSLDTSALTWASEVLRMASLERGDTCVGITENGFNIISVANEFEKILESHSRLDLGTEVCNGL